jgi:hypothetical protein
MKYGYLPSFNDREMDRKRAEREVRRIEDERRAALKKQQRGMGLDFEGGAQ